MYIVFEGIDGTGKTTQTSMLCDALRKLNYAPIRLQEPTYGKIGRFIRGRLATDQNIDREELHNQFTLDRREHVKKKIKPVLAFIKKHPSFVIVQDRCYLSAPAYQARSNDEAEVMLKEQQVIAPRPDVVILLDMPSSIAIERMEQKSSSNSYFEKASFLEEARQRYLFVSDDLNENIHIVDAAGDPVRIHDKVLKILNSTTVG